MELFLALLTREKPDYNNFKHLIVSYKFEHYSDPFKLICQVKQVLR